MGGEPVTFGGNTAGAAQANFGDKLIEYLDRCRNQGIEPVTPNK